MKEKTDTIMLHFLHNVLFRRFKPFILFLFFCFLLIQSGNDAIAQEECGDYTLNEARKFYQTGLFIEVVNSLEPCIKDGFNDNQKVQAYRLLSMTYIAEDYTQKAYEASILLLKINPNYEPSLFDPPQYIQMINNIKLSGAALQVTSVSKKAENLHEAPATVMVITEEDIMKRGYTDLTSLFHDLPGFDISTTYSATFSNIYQRGYRSNNTDRTLFLIDGIEENDLWTNIAMVSRQYPITNIKRVEVIYGPASTMYGANAFVGVINVITKTPEELTKNTPISVIADLGIGSYNTKYADITVAGRKKNISFSASVKRFYSTEMDLSGYEEFDYNPADYDKVDYSSLLSVYDDPISFINDSNFASSSMYYDIITDANHDTIAAELNATGQQAAADLDKNALSETVNGAPVKYSNLSDHWLFYGKLKISDFTLGYQFWRYNQGSTNYFNDNKQAGSDNGGAWVPKQTFFYVKYETEINEKLFLMNLLQYKTTIVDDGTCSVFLSNYSNSSLSANHFIQDKQAFWTSLRLYQVSSQVRNEFKLIYNHTKKFGIVGGIELRSSNLQGDYRMLINPSSGQNVIEDGGSSGDNLPGGNNFTIFDLGAYVQGTYNYKDLLRLTLGGRYDYNRIRVNDGYGSIFNPRIAAVLTPGNFIFKFIYARAFQNASNWTKYSLNPQRQLNNPTLKPEEVNNFELCAGYKFAKYSFFDVVFYSSKYNGAVGTGYAKLPDGSITGQNQAIGQLNIYGLQSTFTYQHDNFSFYANYTYTQPEENILVAGEPTDDYQRLGDISDHRINLGGNILFFDHLNINLRLNYFSQRPVGEGTSVPSNPGNFPAHTIVNGAISYFNIIKGHNGQLILNNIFNTEYSDPGIRSADGNAYSYRTPQKGSNFMIRLYYNLNYKRN
ncbi:MAG: TonB-dependent receptor [Bacteroidales bacterium]|nr:TonB-dependent receptor [Bacteroidales bacterium]